MKDVSICFFFMIFGFLLGTVIDNSLCNEAHKIPMGALGIEKFQKCEINTTNCHSNWYEIVWRKDGK